jgi:transcriptional regulator with XRE-family HTH domain
METTFLLGEKLRLLRLERGWTQTDLARQLVNVGCPHINNVEANRRRPDFFLFCRSRDYSM